MSIWFVSRHPGAQQWAKQHNLPIDHWVSHIQIDQIATEDIIIGSLPVNLAEKVCQLGACYVHLTLDLPEPLRGQELSAQTLCKINAHLSAFTILSSPLPLSLANIYSPNDEKG